MTIVSYAQNFEDVILHRVFADIRQGTYVDVGAWEPVAESVTKAFYDLGWQGINIEPSPVFARLAQARPRDINLNLALGAARGRQMLRVYSDAAQVLQASTLMPEHLPRIPNRVELRAADIEVEVLPLAEVLDTHLYGRHIHFLKIDVEGAEEAVIRGADWQRHRPEVVLIEATRPQSTERSDGAWHALMLAAGYRSVLFDGLNAWFLREESSHRAASFATPPNVFDNFRRHDAQAEQRIAAAEARARSLEAQLAAAHAPALVQRLSAASLPAWAKLRRGDATREARPATVPPVPAETFVRALYLACLGREPEPGALDNWLAHLRGPNGALRVAKQIQSCPEARAYIGAALEPTQADPSLVKAVRAVLHFADGHSGLALIAAGMARVRVERLAYAYRVDRLWPARVLRLGLYVAIRLGNRHPGWGDAAAWHARLLPSLHKRLSLAYRRSLRHVGIDSLGPAQRRIQRRLELLRLNQDVG